MKKLLSIALAAAISCFSLLALSGCDNNNPQEMGGHWACVSVNVDGQDFNFSDAGINGNDLIAVNLNADGTASFSTGVLVNQYANQEQRDAINELTSTPFTWTATTSGDITLFTSDNSAIDFPYDKNSGELTISMEETSMQLKKQ